jgi:hypothetical protein
MSCTLLAKIYGMYHHLPQGLPNPRPSALCHAPPPRSKTSLATFCNKKFKDILYSIFIQCHGSAFSFRLFTASHLTAFFLYYRLMTYKAYCMKGFHYSCFMKYKLLQGYNCLRPQRISENSDAHSEQ